MDENISVCVCSESQRCTCSLLIKTGTLHPRVRQRRLSLMDEFYSNPDRLWAVINCVSQMGLLQIR